MSTSDKNILEDFRNKSSSYYQDVYLLRKDIKRVNRINLIEKILTGFDLAGKKVLDAGSGPAVLYDTIMHFGGDYTALDLSPDNIKAAQSRIPGVNAVEGSVTNMPFDDSCFDFILSIGCLEYIRDLDKVFKEFSRILSNKGILIASFANRNSPVRIWNETIIKFIRNTKMRLQHKNFYRRYLATNNQISGIILNNKFELLQLEYFNNSIFGYPFSKFEIAQIFDDKIMNRINFLKPISSEFLVICRRT
jgi:ubiquinone/menaquinone biosynthesis C-methylase UbiE